MTLEDVLRAPLPDRVDEVAELMRAIEKALPPRDGVRAFTSLYRAVTEDVDRRVRPEAFADAPFTRWLDVVFANLYFARTSRACSRPEAATTGLGSALRGAWATRRGADPVRARRHERAHQPRPPARARRDVPRAQGFPQARQPAARRLPPGRRGARRHGGSRQDRVRDRPDRLGGQGARRLDDVLAMWNVRKARAAAWTNAETLWALRDLPLTAGRFALTLDRTVGFAGRGLLRPLA